MAAHARLKNEVMEDEKCHNLIRWLNYLFRWTYYNDTLMKIFVLFLSGSIIQVFFFFSFKNFGVDWTDGKLYILGISEKLPLLKFRHFENYKRNLDSFFTFHISGQQQIRLEQ